MAVLSLLYCPDHLEVLQKCRNFLGESYKSSHYQLCFLGGTTPILWKTGRRRTKHMQARQRIFPRSRFCTFMTWQARGYFIKQHSLPVLSKFSPASWRSCVYLGLKSSPFPLCWSWLGWQNPDGSHLRRSSSSPRCHTTVTVHQSASQWCSFAKPEVRVR